MDSRPRGSVGSDSAQAESVLSHRYRTPSFTTRLAMAAGAKSSDEALMLRASVLLAQIFHLKPGPSNTTLGEARNCEPAVIKDLFAVRNAKTDPAARAVKLIDATLTNLAQLENLWKELQTTTEPPVTSIAVPDVSAPSTLVKIPTRKRATPQPKAVQSANHLFAAKVQQSIIQHGGGLLRFYIALGNIIFEAGPRTVVQGGLAVATYVTILILYEPNLIFTIGEAIMERLLATIGSAANRAFSSGAARLMERLTGTASQCPPCFAHLPFNISEAAQAHSYAAAFATGVPPATPPVSILTLLALAGASGFAGSRLGGSA
jgi:hypothetical protein